MGRLAPRVAVLVLTLGFACSTDKVLTARKLLAQEPAKAVALLLEADKERKDCLECKVYRGLAYEKLGDLKNAAESYAAALLAQDPWTRPEPVPARLLSVYKKIFDSAQDRADRLAVAKKAAPLEARLKVDDPWANEFLYSRYYRQFKLLADAGKTMEAMRYVDMIQRLYLPRHIKEKVASEATDLLRENFVNRGLSALAGAMGQKLRERGFLSDSGKELVLMNRLTIPSPRQDPSMDPAAPTFPVNLRRKACLPLRAKLEEAVSLMAPTLGIDKIDGQSLNGLFARLFKHARAGFAIRRPNLKRPAGQPYLCMISVPVAGLLRELFPFSEPR